MVKRLFDIVCAAVALVVTAPLIGLAAIGIKLSDHGPVFYRARRVGYLGREFTMFKLRTMRYDGEGSRGAGGAEGPVITGHGDERITTIGKFLRRSKIDELPQLFNVLRGDMAISASPRSANSCAARRSTSCHSCSMCYAATWRSAHHHDRQIPAPLEDRRAATAVQCATRRHGDQRITTIGKFLRRSKIEELPQLFNVLRGDMAISASPRSANSCAARRSTSCHSCSMCYAATWRSAHHHDRQIPAPLEDRRAAT